MKHNIYKVNLLVLFFFLMCCQTTFAQQIKGVVTDSLTNEPLPYISSIMKGKG